MGSMNDDGSYLEEEVLGDSDLDSEKPLAERPVGDTNSGRADPTPLNPHPPKNEAPSLSKSGSRRNYKPADTDEGDATEGPTEKTEWEKRKMMFNQGKNVSREDTMAGRMAFNIKTAGSSAGDAKDTKSFQERKLEEDEAAKEKAKVLASVRNEKTLIVERDSLVGRS
jgi:hypothetical protein